MSETLLEREPGLVHGGRVYVELDQGAMQGQSDGSLRPRYSLADWREAIPVGTRTLLFLLDFDHAERGGFETEHEGRGLPWGATLLVPDPQGMIFEYDGRLLSWDFDAAELWNVDSIEDISRRVREHVAG